MQWIKITDEIELPREEVLVYTKTELFFLAIYNPEDEQWEDSINFDPIPYKVTHYLELNSPCNG